MSLRSVLSSPPLVAGAGVAVLAGMPWMTTMVATTSLATLKAANVVGFLLNMGAVNVPGRLDERQDQALRRGNASSKETTTLLHNTTTTDNNTNGYEESMARSLVRPSGWAFAIWGPIYLGELALVGGQYVMVNNDSLATILPEITVPLCAAHIFQSLWCASFRPAFYTPTTSSSMWPTSRYVAPGMLACTAYSLSLVHASVCTLAVGTPLWWLATLPLTLHFGWTTAATLVNLNGAVAYHITNQEEPTSSDRMVMGVGHASAIVATGLGVGVTLVRSDPIYGATLAWALTACADHMRNRRSTSTQPDTTTTTTSNTILARAERVQQQLCTAGAMACAVAAVVVGLVG